MLLGMQSMQGSTVLGFVSLPEKRVFTTLEEYDIYNTTVGSLGLISHKTSYISYHTQSATH